MAIMAADAEAAAMTAAAAAITTGFGF